MIFVPGSLLLLAFVSGMHRGLGDKYVIPMDELVQPLDRHVKHLKRPVAPFRRLVRRKVRRPNIVSSVDKRSADGEPNKFAVDDAQFRSGGIQILTKQGFGECGAQKIHFEPPLHSTRIRNGTCTPYGAFPWTVQIQVGYFFLLLENAELCNLSFLFSNRQKNSRARSLRNF